VILSSLWCADKEDLFVESRRPPAVMTSSTPGNFECDLHDSNPHLVYKDGSSNSWGGSLQRKKANMSKCRHQQEDCQSLASLEAMVKKKNNMPQNSFLQLSHYRYENKS
jgi:hypothetical protein